MIYINGRFLSKPMVGVTRYASEILRCFDKPKYVDKIVVLIPKNCVGCHTPEYLKTMVVGHYKGNLWEQFSLPAYLRKQKDAKLLNLCNASPLNFRGFTVVHDISFVHLARTYSWLFTEWYKYMIRKKVKTDHLIFTVSEFSKDDMVSYYGIPADKVLIAPCGMEHITRVQQDDSIIAKYKLDGVKYNLFVGSDFVHKNISLIKELAGKDPDTTYVFVSRDPEGPIAKNTIFISEDLSLPRLKSLYAHADTLFMVSTFEGFGMPPMEAIISGTKHIMLSAIPVFHEIYGDRVDYVPVNKQILMGKMKPITPEYKQYLSEKYLWSKSAEIIYNAINNYDVKGAIK